MIVLTLTYSYCNYNVLIEIPNHEPKRLTMDEKYMLDAAALLCALRRRIKVGKMACFHDFGCAARFLEIPILGFLELQNGKLEP